MILGNHYCVLSGQKLTKYSPYGIFDTLVLFTFNEWLVIQPLIAAHVKPPLGVGKHIAGEEIHMNQIRLMD